MATRAKLVRIGNSRGIRIPKPLITQAGLGDEVDLEVRDGVLLVLRAPHPRAGWATAFSEMAAHGDDVLDGATGSTSTWDDEEWEWR